jgi:hypothetical protein
LTEEEAKVLENYLTHKIIRLEEAGLTDSFCYPRLYQIRRKINLQNKENAI